MDEIILSVAPTGPWEKGQQKVLSPEEIVDEAVRCSEEGAAVIHLLPAGREKRPFRDMSTLEKTFHGIYDNTDLIIEAGTEGRPGLSLEEKLLPATLEGAVFASLNMGSFNLAEEVFSFGADEIRLCLDRMDQYRVKPSLEIYDTGHLVFARKLIDEGLLEPPYNFTFVFNVPWGMVFSQELLAYLVGQLPTDSNWGSLITGSRDFGDFMTAAEMGADFLRVGLDYTPWLGGPEVFTSAQLLKKLRENLMKTGRETMSPGDAEHKLLLIGA
ncbi:MAG: 3-keto-5-aminohexanoate cleavage protein [Spirochaetales bacterium]|nr:3-keto-5-aminohexanoate cleavage protein [Spirochaetales bacterium]